MNYLTLKLFIMTALTMTLFSACKKECIEGSDNEVTIERTLTAFQRVDAAGFFPVYVHKSSEYKVQIKGDDNVVGLVRTELSNVTLKIYLPTKCVRKSPDLEVHVYMPSAERLVLSGSGGLIATDGIEGDVLDLVLSGSGSIKASSQTEYLSAKVTGSGNISIDGKSSIADFEVQGSGDIRAYNLIAEDASILISGSGNTLVHVTNHIDAQIKGSGDVRYKGEATVSSAISGSGNVYAE